MGIWRLIEDIPRSGSFNMAADQVLLENYSQNEHPVFRIYEWAGATLSLGRNEKLDKRIDLDACEDLGIAVIRRTTGGKAVLHGFDLTYSLVGGVLDKQFNGGVLDNYRFIAKGFYAFFEELGLKPELQEQSPQKKKTDPHVCFAEPSAYEILVEGRKIIGSAQRVKNIRSADSSSSRVFLQHGSIPLKDSVSLMAKIFPYVSEDKLRQEMHSLESVGIFPAHSKQELRRLLLEKLQDTFKLKWENRGWSEEELSLIAEREAAFQTVVKAIYT
ncbi:lipoate--protein ligase family protein [bacterium]|jgi:lipoate-protein ligase A|nr:lipoate--protein ligase family protein [Deltaproteobacteria bacterium]MDB3917266.1 lipoate--protein ligase family protein [bacterium]